MGDLSLLISQLAISGNGEWVAILPVDGRNVQAIHMPTAETKSFARTSNLERVTQITFLGNRLLLGDARGKVYGAELKFVSEAEKQKNGGKDGIEEVLLRDEPTPAPDAHGVPQFPPRVKLLGALGEDLLAVVLSTNVVELYNLGVAVAKLDENVSGGRFARFEVKGSMRCTSVGLSYVLDEESVAKKQGSDEEMEDVDQEEGKLDDDDSSLDAEARERTFASAEKLATGVRKKKKRGLRSGLARRAKQMDEVEKRVLQSMQAKGAAVDATEKKPRSKKQKKAAQAAALAEAAAACAPAENADDQILRLARLNQTKVAQEKRNKKQIKDKDRVKREQLKEQEEKKALAKKTAQEQRRKKRLEKEEQKKEKENR